MNMYKMTIVNTKDNTILDLLRKEDLVNVLAQGMAAKDERPIKIQDRKDWSIVDPNTLVLTPGIFKPVDKRVGFYVYDGDDIEGSRVGDAPVVQEEMFAKSQEEIDAEKKGMEGQIRRLFAANKALEERVKKLEGQVEYLIGKAVGKGAKAPTMCGEHGVPMKWKGNRHVCEMCAKD